jgi:hypothetical protein
MPLPGYAPLSSASIVAIPAVELDHEAVTRPRGIDLHALDVRVHPWPGKRVRLAERDEALLEDRAEELRPAAPVLIEDGSERGVSGAGAMARAGPDLLDLPHVEHAEVLRLAEHLGHAVARDHVGEVHQGASDGGDRDPLDGGEVLGIEGRGVVDVDAGSVCADPPGGRDVDARPIGGAEPVQRRRFAVAERSAGAAGDDGRQPVSLDAELAVAEGVDAGVETDELPGLDPHLDHRGSQSDRRELPAGDHPVLALRKARERDSGHLCVYGRHG